MFFQSRLGRQFAANEGFNILRFRSLEPLDLEKQRPHKLPERDGRRYGVAGDPYHRPILYGGKQRWFAGHNGDAMHQQLSHL